MQKYMYHFFKIRKLYIKPTISNTTTTHAAHKKPLYPKNAIFPFSHKHHKRFMELPN